MGKTCAAEPGALNRIRMRCAPRGREGWSCHLTGRRVKAWRAGGEGRPRRVRQGEAVTSRLGPFAPRSCRDRSFLACSAASSMAFSSLRAPSATTEVRAAAPERRSGHGLPLGRQSRSIGPVHDSGGGARLNGYPTPPMRQYVSELVVGQYVSQVERRKEDCDAPASRELHQRDRRPPGRPHPLPEGPVIVDLEMAETVRGRPGSGAGQPEGAPPENGATARTLAPYTGRAGPCREETNTVPQILAQGPARQGLTGVRAGVVSGV